MDAKTIVSNGSPDRQGKKYPVEVYSARVKGHSPISIKIYLKNRGTAWYWLVEDRSSGRRRLLNCRTHEAALDRANEIAEAIAKGKQAILGLERKDLDSYQTAKEAVQPYGFSVHVACQDYAQALKMLAGRRTVLEAVRFFIEQDGCEITPKKFNETKIEFLQHKSQQGVSNKQQSKIQGRLNRFTERFGDRLLHTITPGELEKFLTGMDLAPKTFNHYRKDLSALFAFARLSRFTPKDFNPAREFKAASEGFRHVEYIKSDQMKKLLAAAQTGDEVLYLVLCGFAGLRPCETKRVRWEMIGPEYMRLPVGISGKKGKPRNIVECQLLFTSDAN